MIYDELNTNNTENIVVCKYSKSSIELDNFIKNKLLFDYSKDYDNISMHTAHAETTCNNVYLNYIKEYIDIYVDAYSNCTGNSDKRYECNKYSEILNEELYPILSTFSCIHSENGREVLETQRAPEKPETAFSRHSTLPRIMGSGRDRHTAVGPILNKQQNLRSLEDPRPIDALSIDDNSGSSSSKTIAGSVAPVLGVSSISLLLYKVIENIIDNYTFIIYMCIPFFK
ncbi:hypothetical protein PVIIG_06297 [Plasmodium vivax India VII]|uniref:PIR Superfamily Protein n=1 Tax=Plasmodium vivax India VII TaxID=1077284 RepID=A0A0J9UTV5_PLAVI|nr:hypothetical protein PVIIG_06297 [Plasmodium vivax India VII]